MVSLNPRLPSIRGEKPYRYSLVGTWGLGDLTLMELIFDLVMLKISAFHYSLTMVVCQRILAP
jgi:hypothetical protein